MHCPKCSTSLCLCELCRRIYDCIVDNTDSELLICKGCRLTRPVAWWDALQLDIETEIDLTKKAEEAPEELSGQVECPWGD